MTQKFFRYPDETIFHGDGGQGFKFSDARLLEDENEKLKHLEIRMKKYYLDGFKRTRNPFTIAVMTCIGVELLGQIMLGFREDGETISDNTIKVYEWLHPTLTEPLSTPFKDTYNMRRNADGNHTDYANGLINYAAFLRKGLRNSFSHSYRSLGVVLGDDAEEMIRVDEVEGMMVVSAKLFRRSLWREFRMKFRLAISGSEPSYRAKALAYFELLVRA